MIISTLVMHTYCLHFWRVSVLIVITMCRWNRIIKKKREMKGKGERELEGRGRTSSYLELLSCNLLERRQERYKQKSQTDSFWLWREWNISYLVAKWQSVLIVHNTATTLRRGKPGLKSKKIPVVFLLPSSAIYFSLIFLHKHTPLHCMLPCFTLYKWPNKNFGQLLSAIHF